jgi:hypothetical protein
MTPAPPIQVNLLLWLHRGGQIHSIALLRDLLQSELGCKVRTIITSRQNPAEAFRADINLFSSEVHPAWMKLAEKNILIANLEQDCRQSSITLRPERFNETGDQLRYLRRLDRILVKTRVAEEVFTRLGLPAAYVGFTARDRYLPEVIKADKWLCVMGDNFGNKDLPPVLRVWERNKDFPPLTVVLREPPFELPELPNIVYRQGYLSDEELRILQNRCAIHLCPSAMEGFGHAIVEAMSTGALVITADAAPMNEHVSEERGALYRVTDPVPHAFARKWTMDEASLEQTVRRVMGMNSEAKQARGLAARGHFLAAAGRFGAELMRHWEEICRL